MYVYSRTTGLELGTRPILKFLKISSFNTILVRNPQYSSFKKLSYSLKRLINIYGVAQGLQNKITKTIL